MILKKKTHWSRPKIKIEIIVVYKAIMFLIDKKSINFILPVVVMIIK